MAVPFTRLQALNIMTQVSVNLNGLQSDFRLNALAWKALAQAQSATVASIAGDMSSAATAYQTRLGWLPTLQANTSAWNAVVALWTVWGGTAAEFTSLMTPFNTVANQLVTIDKSSYAAIITACDQILAYIDKPVSLWPIE